MLINTGIKIDGIDISQWIAARGINWSRKNVEGSNGGMTLDGKSIHDVLASKVCLEITCQTMPQATLRTLQTMLLPTELLVYYDDPIQGPVLKTMHCREGKASNVYVRPSGEMWSGVKFKLEEI